MPLSMELWVSIFRSCLNSLADRFRSVIYSSFCIQPVHTNTRTHTHKLKLFLSPASISPLYSLLWLLASAAALRSTAGAAERLHFLKLFLGAGEHGRSNPHVSALPLFRRARAFAERFFCFFPVASAVAVLFSCTALAAGRRCINRIFAPNQPVVAAGTDRNRAAAQQYFFL